MMKCDDTVFRGRFLPLSAWIRALFCLGRVLGLIGLLSSVRGQSVLVEAESLADLGGWKLDTQFIETMGSPYLLAHGLGQPVADAVTKVTFPEPGRYRVWVRTKDWVARWQAPGAPGKFQVLIDGKPLKEIFGTHGVDWFWQDGGEVFINQLTVSLALHDLTGFEGRCDALYFTIDPVETPPNELDALATWRRRALNLGAQPVAQGPYDFVVVGGGYAGMCSALAAARLGARVALLQNRFVLGGNGSSEVRVWPQGNIHLGLFPRLGDIVAELADKPTLSPGRPDEFDDARKEAILRAEPNIALFLGHQVHQVETQAGRIVAVLAFDTRTSEVKRFPAKLFADCTGHGTIGALAGADHTVKETGHLGMSNMWRWRELNEPVSFPETPWALDLDMNDFPYPQKHHGQWFWESGFDQHPLQDLEYMRDWNLRAVYGAFNAMKNRSGRPDHLNAQLEWIAYIGGTRESRQLLGDVVLTSEDVVVQKAYPDGCVPTTWSIDLHYPDATYQKKYPEDPFISRAEFGRGVDRNKGYPVPYRCFYSRNIDNLFMAGRCISVTHEALGTVRVMKTGGMMGEVVGKAASLCLQHDCSPQAVYQNHLDELKDLMRLPGDTRRDSVQDPITIPALSTPKT